MMNISQRTKQWLLWLTFTCAVLAVLAYIMLVEHANKSIFMPGALSNGHHQLVDKCDTCHTDAFGGGEVLQKACVGCHGDVRKKPLDTHPEAKFKDPRNADLLQKINALECVSCHVEHKREITQKDGLTQPKDFCVHCHLDIGEDRESHKDMAFDTCKDSGCHNFHDNRALYTKYLQKHFGEANLLGEAFMPKREFASVLDTLPNYPTKRYPVQALGAENIDALQQQPIDPGITQQWLGSAHARAGANCTACHNTEVDGASIWQDHPGAANCAQCHDNEVNRFAQGKHGMRLVQGLSPMSPAQARLPMKATAAHAQLTCNSCHPAHDYKVRKAAVDACLDCHDDEHSLAYKNSKHFTLWQSELAGTGAAESGVSCASCHMPRVAFDISEWSSRIIVDHNQSANLSPNSMMVRTSCQNCHGLQFSLDAMADVALIARNFDGRPTQHVPSLKMADSERQRHEKNKDEHDDNSMFGF